ncbi:xylose isomerase-like protein [Plectosphaerella plurivora]|uniref:Apurinic-apyrimidinic endonuclease 1 n=1 Tax=Plectosphaerella plurivora TaxID=936078 RepID=A0A9P8VD97_9PEZI|nr:xylose isomerase-like protein [Plectosphaerella plurivora]
MPPNTGRRTRSSAGSTENPTPSSAVAPVVQLRTARKPSKRKAEPAVKAEPKREQNVKVEPQEEKNIKTESIEDRAVKSEVKDEPAVKAEEDACQSCGEGKDDTEKQPAKKRKTKATKDEEMNPLAPRTAVSALGKAMYIGAHVSGAGGVHNSVTNAVNIGANAFAVFLKSQRKWESPPLAADAKKQFLELSKQHKYNAAAHVLPHGSYLVNLAQADPAKATQAYDNFVDDLKRCEQLGIQLYNFHPGNTGGADRGEACRRIAAQLNRAHAATKTVITVLENMAGTGNVIGTKFEDLRDIIAAVEDPSRVGVCIDTCHAFAAGYDLRTPEAVESTFAEFDRLVGHKYLKAFHFNDSKAPFASHRDLHANIGTGFLGLRAFHAIVNRDDFQGLPMVLETPIDRKDAKGKSFEDRQVWADEIKLLESLVGMDTDTDDFRKLEEELQAKGVEDRAKFQDQADRKAALDAKKAAAPKRGAKAKAAPKAKAKPRARKAKKESSEDEEESD